MTAPKAFVVGWPIKHSRSPLIHRFWLKRYGIQGDYVREAVPLDTIDKFLENFSDEGFVGGNVTLPHKEAAFRACATATPVARRLEAVNTLWREGEKLYGDNTDAYGFAANLDERAPEWRSGSTALVIGAGGASRAVLQALIDAKFQSVVVLNRTLSRAEGLARHFAGPVIAGGLDRLPEVLATADLIVNATSAALHDAAGLDVPWRLAKRSAIATDLVYVPLVTPFLSGASEAGLKIVDGLGMLLHQAVPGFERWFGVRPAVDAALRDHVAADIKG
jgi:shikimate dehydrogenase